MSDPWFGQVSVFQSVFKCTVSKMTGMQEGYNRALKSNISILPQTPVNSP